MKPIGGSARIELAGGPPKPSVERRVTIEGVPEPLVVGVHGPYAELSRVPGAYPARATANDLFVAGLAACLVGTFAAALAARGIAVEREMLTADARWEIGPATARSEPIVRSVHVRLLLALPAEQHATARRVHGVYHKGCWLSQTLEGSRCAVTSELALAAPDAH